MLRRFDWIEDCGHFEQYRWDSNLPEFSRLTVIYGPNGTGKTSLAGALDGLRNPPETEGFKKLSVTVEESATKTTTNGSDNAMFNRVFVFSDRYVRRSHRFSPAEAEMDAVLTIGEKAADAEVQLAELRKKLQVVTEGRDTAVTDKRAADASLEAAYDRIAQQVVDAAGKAGGRYHSRSNFSTRVVKTEFGRADHSSWIELSESDFKAKVGIINADKAEELASSGLDVAVPSDVQDRLRTLLGTTPTSIVLDSLREHPAATTWVDEGRSLHHSVDECIFCGSELTEQRRELIELHFSEAVRVLDENHGFSPESIIEFPHPVRATAGR